MKRPKLKRIKFSRVSDDDLKLIAQHHQLVEEIRESRKLKSQNKERME